MDIAGVFLKKQWFITTKPGDVENFYKFDKKKVSFNKP